jgi:small-conductance mechanosensitive channel
MDFSSLPWLSQEYYHNPVYRWLLAALTALATLVVIRLLRWVARRQLDRKPAAERSGALRLAAGALEHTRWFFYLALSIDFGSQFLELPGRTGEVLDAVAVVAALVQAGIWAQAAIRLAVDIYGKRRAEQGGAGAVTMAAALGFLARIAVWSVVLLLVLSNLGIEISALIAGLGVGGIAAALAVQNVAGDLIASLSIYFDRPFDIGDFIIVDEHLGNIERVGLRSTRMRTLWGDQLVFANGDLIKSRIRNFTRMEARRIHFTIGVVYHTSYEKLRRIPEIIREIIEGVDTLEHLRSHFKGYGDYALLFETAYRVLDPDYDVYMDRQQQMNLEIIRRFREEGIELAYPTQTLYVQRDGREPGSSSRAA